MNKITHPVTLTHRQYDVMRHASNNGRYVTSEVAVLELAERGLLHDHGPQALAAGDHYLTVTPSGRQAINAYESALPKPKIKKRRKSTVFEEWQNFCDACQWIPFGEFWKKRHEIYPHR